MSNCPTKVDLQRLLNDDLSVSMRGVVAGHIDHCLNCQRELDVLTANSDLTGHDSKKLDEVHDSTITELVKRLCESPWGLPDSATFDGDDIHFPEPPSESAPLGSLGNYRIQERIAAGANGILYRAIDVELGRTVGIKVLRESVAASSVARMRLLREARAAATIKSDYVVPVLQVGSHPRFPPFLVLEFVEGISLREKLDATHILAPQEAAAIARDAALGLSAAHHQGLVHRDVKPSNILLDKTTGRARLTDFGLARNDQEVHRLTLDGTIAGTPAYMSVEQLTDPTTVDGRTDIYGLGVVLYELITGNLPFRGVLRMTVSQILHDEPVAPRRLNDAIPRDLETICLKAMAKHRDHRYASASDLADDLGAFLHGRPISARPTTAIQKGILWCSRNRIVASLTGAVAGLLILLTIVSAGSALRLSKANRAAMQLAMHSAGQRDAALGTLGKLVFDIQDKFDSEEIDLDDLQTNVLQVALDGLQRVDPTGEHGGVSELQLATAYRRLGEILARTEGTKQADDYLQRALQILESIIQSDASRAEVLRQLAETELSRSDFFASDNDVMAAKSAQKAVQWSKTLQSLDRQDDVSRRLLTDSFVALGQCALARGNEADAISAFREAVKQFSFAPDRTHLDLAEWRSHLEALFGLAQAQQFQGLHEASLMAWQELLSETSAFRSAFPSDVDSNRYLFSAFDGMEVALVELNRADEATQVSHRAEQLMKELNNNSSAGPLYLDDVVSMFEGLAQHGARIGDVVITSRNDQRRVDFLRYRLEQAPLDSHARHNLGLALLDQATTLANQNEASSAFDRTIEAIALLEPLAQSTDRDPGVVESYAEALEHAEDISLSLGRNAEASTFREKNDKIKSQTSDSK